MRTYNYSKSDHNPQLLSETSKKTAQQHLQRLKEPCPRCNSKIGILANGKGPHLASLRCKECDHFFRWVGRAELAEIGLEGGVR